MKNFIGKKVLVTGHTGFKGSWLVFTLNFLGAQVYGFAISEPKALKHVYHSLNIKKLLINKNSHLGDVRSPEFVMLVRKIEPDFIFHLAAQAIVKTAYTEPHFTFSTNVMGILNLLEYLRESQSKATVVIITSDKCYKDLENQVAHIETDELGGSDPYSASKAAAELLIGAYLNSYQDLCQPGGIASARAGNVFGGGDWSQDRLIPDLVRNLFEKKPIQLRMPKAVRPWTYVHDVIRGYLYLAAALRDNPEKHRGSWNFSSSETLNVEQVAKTFIDYLGSGTYILDSPNNLLKEVTYLQINPFKANSVLNWWCQFPIDIALEKTAEWYSKQNTGSEINTYSYEILKEFYQ